jgi:hypothetical protein
MRHITAPIGIVIGVLAVTNVNAAQPWHAPHALVYHHASGKVRDAATGNTGTWSMTAYTVSGPTQPPPGATVYSPAQIRAVKAMELRSQARHASSCTRGCGYWNFGCPNTIVEVVTWDEEDAFNVPIYHQTLKNEVGVNCKTAWTFWRDVSDCSTYVYGWSCETPIPNGNFWKPGWWVNWSDTTFKYVAPGSFGWVCEEDTLDMRNNTGPGGGVNGQAWSPGERTC